MESRIATMERSFYRNGQVHQETPLRNGRLHGLARTWYKNGALASEAPYEDGQLHGLCRQWDEKGKLLGEYRMVHGTGIQRVWFANGVLQWEQWMINGGATGPCRLWLRDGSLTLEQWLIENREVTPAQYAKEALDHPDWPRYSGNGTLPGKASPARQKRAFYLHCEWLLGKQNTQEAAAWLDQAKVNDRAIGALSGKRARKVVSDTLAAGARRVIAADTYVSKQGKQFVDVLLVELPTSKAQRAAIRKVFMSLPHAVKCALQPGSDHGDPWLYVYFG